MATLDQRQPRWAIEIEGVRRTLLSGSARLSAAAFVATFDGALLLSEGKPKPGQRVRVLAGYGAALAPIFGGEIDANGVQARPNDLTIKCSGFLARTRDPIGVAPSIIDAVDGPQSDPEPVVTYEGQNGAEIIADLMVRYGVPAYDLQSSGDLFGELEPVPLMADDSGASLIQDLDEAELSGDAPYRGFWRTWDGPDGVVHRLPWSRVASGTAARTFTDAADLYAGSLEASRLGLRNRVLAFGLPQSGTTGVAFVPTGAAEAANDLVPTPPGFRAVSYDLPLLESGARCQAWAEAKLGELNRETGSLPVDLVAGDPTLWPGMTVAVQSATLGLGGSERFLIEELTHDLSESEGFNTSLGLYLTAEGAGYNPNLPPVAVVTLKAHRETLADGSDQYEVALDGTASYDPELGQAGIVSYLWSGTPTDPTPTGVGTTATVIYPDEIPPGATVTLTVLDTLGASGSLTLPVTATSATVVTRDIIAAELTAGEASRDGQRTWAEIICDGSPVAARGTCEIGGPTYTLMWED